jgi:hypothetical protein
LSVQLPENPLRGYLKLELTVMQRGAGLERGRLKVGALIMSGSLTDGTAVRFSELAVANTARARAVQDKSLFGLSESDFMAKFRDLPEFTDGNTSRRACTGMGASVHTAVIAGTENRISSTRFFGQLTS